MMAFRLFHSKRKVVDFDACHQLQHRVELVRLGRSDVADQSVMIGRRREQRQPLNDAIAIDLHDGLEPFACFEMESRMRSPSGVSTISSDPVANRELTVNAAGAW